MNTQSLDLNQTTLEKLFQEGDCLTFSYTDSVNFDYIIEAQRKYQKEHNTQDSWVIFDVAKLCLQRPFSPFHFFSNGVLIHRFSSKEPVSDMLAQIGKTLMMHGYKIKQVFGPQSDMEVFDYGTFLDKISKYATEVYPAQKSIHIVSLPEKKEFVENCFSKGQVLLTASDAEKINPEYRKCLALFNDGAVYVSSAYKISNLINDPSVVYAAIKAHRTQNLILERRYIPQDYLDALYEKAKSYGWYLSEDKTPQELKNKKAIKPQDLKDIESLCQNRKCISIVNPPHVEGYYKIRRDMFVLFDDGKLIINADYRALKQEDLISSLSASFPKLKFDIKEASASFIDSVYAYLSKTQKTPEQIFIEILKQKARFLKKELQIPHHEALEICAKMIGFKDFKQALQITEQNALYAIDQEKYFKEKYAKIGKNYTMIQYEGHIKNS